MEDLIVLLIVVVSSVRLFLVAGNTQVIISDT